MSDSLQPHELQHASLPVHHQLPESTQTHIHWVGDAIQPSHPLRPLLLLLSIFPSIRVFSNESTLPIRWPKYWSFSFNISPSNEHPGLISFRMDWLDLLAVQGTLKSLLQHHSSKASVLWCSAFFIVQLTRPLEKPAVLCWQTFVDKAMSLLYMVRIKSATWNYSSFFLVLCSFVPLLPPLSIQVIFIIFISFDGLLAFMFLVIFFMFCIWVFSIYI